MAYVIAIDGPAGSGKGTITKLVAERLGIINIDTGIIYRCVALEVLNRGIDIKDVEKIVKVVDEIKIEIKYEGKTQLAILNGKNVSKEVRSKEVTNIVSEVSSPKEVREKVTQIERKIGTDNLEKGNSIIMEGIDITTVVFPNADIKIYLDAKPEERARRRVKQNEEKGIASNYDEILKSIIERDKNDMSKEVGALKRVEDAVYIDSTNMTIEEVAEEIIKTIK